VKIFAPSLINTFTIFVLLFATQVSVLTFIAKEKTNNIPAKSWAELTCWQPNLDCAIQFLAVVQKVSEHER